MLELPLSHLLNFYAGVVIELEKRNIHYEFYTNGLSKDLDIMQGIEKILNRRFNVRVPRTIDDFLSMIASFDGIICARTHSCIAAYSFGRPAVAFDWCEKVPIWFQNINEPSNCLPINKLDPAYAVDKLLELKNRGYDELLREKLEKQHIEILKYAIRLTS